LSEETPEALAPEPTPAVVIPEVVAPVYAVEPEPEVVIEPEVVSTAPAAAVVEEPKSKNDAPTPSKLSGTKRVVRLSKLVFESSERNSASVGLVQYRLVERGHYDAGSDKYGWLSVGTRKALASFAGVSAEKVNLQDEKVIKRLFEGTDVEVI
jgi:hypothetical protein